MTPNLQLAAMASTKGHEIFIAKYHFCNWSCSVEGKTDDIAFKCKGEGETFAEAVAACYDKWLRMTGALPEFNTMLAAPEAPFEVVDDEIPY